MNKYGNGRISALVEMRNIIKKEIDDIKASPSEGNINRQITNGGKLHAYNKLIQKVNTKIRRTEEYKAPFDKYLLYAIIVIVIVFALLCNYAMCIGVHTILNK